MCRTAQAARRAGHTRPGDHRLRLSCYDIGKTLEGDLLRQALDYRAYALNHYHMPFWAQPGEPDPRGYACHMLAMAHSLIVSGKADCLVHPLDAGYARNRIGAAAVSQANAAITDQEMASCSSWPSSTRLPSS
jgi:hypothetical protein